MLALRLLLLFLASFGGLPCEALTRIATDETCYEPGDNIQVAFQTDNPTVHDWIAILPPDTALDPFAAHVTIDWTRTCGSKNCNQPVATPSGSVGMATTHVVTGTWKVVLVTLGPGVWVGVAESQSFEMTSAAGGCSSSGGGGGGSTPQPTLSPTPRPTPTLAPTITQGVQTPVPTSAPINQGSSSISTDKSLYSSDENILVTFQNSNPRNDDWVGIYQASTPSNNLQEGEFWMWMCGGQGSLCTSALTQGSLTFGPGGLQDEWQQSWPAQNGSYKAVLARNSAQLPYEAIAESATFSISTRPTPTLSPTRSAPLPSNRISTNSRSYLAHEDIEVSFQGTNPRRGDFIAIFEASVPSDDLTQGEFWMWACGGKNSCSNAVGSGTVVFGEGGDDESWRQRWPLRGGTYKALLLRNTGRPWPVIAESETFTVFDLSAMIEDTADDIRLLLSQRPELGPKFVRLGFHDCVGGCDGCVDLLNADNNGLEVPMSALQSIVDEHENEALGFSRADIWALAALVGADVAQPFPIIDLTMTTIGRVNCEEANNRCLDDQGVQRPCRSDRGPHRELPHADITTDKLFHFFSDEFGFDVKETVALFGAHTLGVLTRENSGFDGQDGWVTDETVLDNNYFFELVGIVDRDEPFVNQVDDAPPWFRAEEDNSDLPGIPNRHVWEAFPEGPDGQRILMLNADIAIVRELTDDNMDEDGRVSCAFIGRGRCPHAARSLDFAAEYFLDNTLWLNDFKDVFTKMLMNRYTRTVRCFGDLCYLAVS